MTLIPSLLIVLLFVVGIFFVLRTQDTNRRTTGATALQAEYRTDLPLDECLDRLREPSEQDLFAYTITREANGSFSLQFTLHRPTSQSVDTLYSLRLDSGRQTVISLVFLREAFGYKEPVFPPEMLDAFFAAKLCATRTH